MNLSNLTKKKEIKRVRDGSKKYAVIITGRDGLPTHQTITNPVKLAELIRKCQTESLMIYYYDITGLPMYGGLKSTQDLSKGLSPEIKQIYDRILKEEQKKPKKRVDRHEYVR
jgi:hypothetical protein